MKVLSSVLLIQTEDVIPQFVGCCADPLKEGNQIVSQSFLSADKHVVRISEEMVEAEGVITDPAATNSAHRLFGYVRNISPSVVNLFGQHLDQKIESFVVGSEIQGVSGGAYETEVSVIAHPRDQLARGISGPDMMIPSDVELPRVPDCTKNRQVRVLFR